MMLKIRLSVFFSILFQFTLVFGDSFSTDPLVVEAYVEVEDQSIREYFSNESEFNYFENQSFGSSQSLFIYGLDQRYVKLRYNGFELKDPSSPLGVLDLSLISRLEGFGVQENHGAEMNLVSLKSAKPRLSTSLSSLGEFGVNLRQSVCKKVSCFKFGVSANRIGEYNQSLNGKEKDSSNELVLNFSHNSEWGSASNKAYFLYSGKDSDYDAFQIDDPNSNLVNSFIFFGDELEFLKTYKVKFGYTNIYRSFDSPSFKTRGENIDLSLNYNKSLEVFLLRQSQEESYDYGGGVRFLKKGLVSASYTYTNLREGFLNLDFYHKAFQAFYHEVPVSLFQESYNRLNARGLELSMQKSLGLKYQDFYGFKDFIFGAVALYQRAFDQIEYVFTQDIYENFSDIETLYLKLSLELKGLKAYAQFQRSKDLELKKDLPRRSRWVSGLSYKLEGFKFKPGIDLSWHSRRKSFSGTDLSSFVVSKVFALYNGFEFRLSNALDQDESIFLGLRRRPLRFEVLKTYYF